jgi:hypothetical protein
MFGRLLYQKIFPEWASLPLHVIVIAVAMT